MTDFRKQRPSSPNSLLWAHQLRREHNTLLCRFDGIEATNAALQGHTTALQASSEEGRACSEKLRGDVARLIATAESSDIAVTKLQTSLARMEVDANKVTGELRLLGDRLDKVVSGRSLEVSSLAQRMEHLEKKLEVVLRSMKHINPSNDAARPVQADSYHNVPSGDTTADEAASGSLDLDEGMLMDMETGITMHIDTLKRLPLLGDSLVPEPEISSQEVLQNSLVDLRQAGTTVQEYFQRGTALYRGFPRRREGLVVNAFVEGLENEAEKRSLEVWLDEGGWYWHRVEAYLWQSIDTRAVYDRQLPKGDGRAEKQGETRLVQEGAPDQPEGREIPVAKVPDSQMVKQEGSQQQSQGRQKGVPARSRHAKRRAEACAECRKRRRRCNGQQPNCQHAKQEATGATGATRPRLRSRVV